MAADRSVVESEMIALLPRLRRFAFSDVLTAPVPIALARKAVDAGAALDRHAPANRRARPGSGRLVAISAAAAIVFGVLGLFAGHWTGQSSGREEALALAEAETRRQFGWIAQIVGYHRLFAAEDRHLVEVGADETGHIQAWLRERTGRNFTVPDLTAQGLEFRGARLLAVNGKATAQLMYVPLAGGDPVGICFLASGAADGDFTSASRDGFNLVTWRREGFSFIAIGTLDAGEIGDVARTAAVSL